MGKEKKLFKSKESKSRDEASAFLHQLADKISHGRVILRQGDDELVLDLPGQLVLEVQAEDENKGKKGVQHSLEIEFKWFDSQEGSPLALG